MISGDRVLGGINLENYEREHAYEEAQLRLLTTIAGSLGAALQNAFLFNETERLLKETEQRLLNSPSSTAFKKLWHPN